MSKDQSASRSEGESTHPGTTDARRIDNLRRIADDPSVNAFARSICGEAASRLVELIASATVRSERLALLPPTDAEVSAYRDLFRSELDKRMDTRHPSASPSTESHKIALSAFVKARNTMSN